MAKSKKVSLLRGRRLRATLVDANGRPVIGEDSAVVTKGFITVSMTTNMEEGEAISQTNASGETCIAESATPQLMGFGVEATFCEVDFALFHLLTGQELVYDADGVVVGITESTDVDLSTVAFALELWLGATNDDTAPAEGSEGKFGYVLLPFLGGGIIGDYSIENAAITFTVTSMNTKNGSGWGEGPYAVELVDGVPSPLYKPLKANDHRRTMVVEVAPPPVYSGAIPVLDPGATALTDITATADGLTVEVAPTPAGTGVVFYDFGDGEWDIAETGAYSHTYAAPGNYTITARRGLSKVTKEVAVNRP